MTSIVATDFNPWLTYNKKQIYYNACFNVNVLIENK